MSSVPPDLSRLRIERPPGAPRRRLRTWKPWAGLALALVALLWWWTARSGGVEVSTARVLRVSAASAASGTAANGYVVARRRASLSTDIQGRIVELNVEEGDRVRQGDVIARLDTSESEATLARLLSLEAEARAQATWAEQDHARKLPLVADGSVTAADLDLSRATHERAAATLAAAQAAVSELRAQLAKSEVRAPFDGVITQKNAEVGEVVASFSAGANTRGSVATLVDFDTLEVQVELAQTSLRAAAEGASVLIYLDAWPDRAYRGRVRQIWPQADRQKATVELRAEFLERDERILPELGCRVVFLTEAPAEGEAPRGAELRVNSRAVVAGADGAPSAVFVLLDERVERREIVLAGTAGPGLSVVASGLSGGETVVLDPPASLRDGDTVRLRADE